jgi:DNA-binding NarL/FixJ family response regulator
MSERIRILIADDHAVVRQGLLAFLQLQSDFEVVGAASDGPATVALARRLRPDIVLIDLVMPGGDGLSAIRSIREAVPTARVVALTSYVDDAHLFAALQAGAAGYLVKDIEPDALATAIRQAHQGLPALHPQVASRLVHHVAEPAGLADFTRRERDVLKLITEGLANKEIARRLTISEKTVKTHVSSVLQKLGARDRTQAALAAVRRGLVD